MNKPKYILSILISLLTITSLVGQNSFTVRLKKTNSFGTLKTGTIEEALMTVRPKGLYMEYGIYLTISGRDNGYLATDTLEATLNFQLPENAAITDSWLWIGESICRASLQDVWSATNIYNNLVGIRTDPSLLTKTSASGYRLRVFPLIGDEPRKVKITFLSPVAFSNNNVDAFLPVDIINASKTIPLEAKVIAWDTEDWKFKNISNGYHSPIEKLEDGNGNYYSIFSMHRQATNYQPVQINYSQDVLNGLYFGFYETPTENYYQIAIQPREIVKEISSNKVLYLVDVQQPSTPSKEVILIKLINEIKKTLSSADSFNIVLSNINVQPLFSNWTMATEENLELAYELALLQLQSFSNLHDVISTGIQFINQSGGKGKIVILNNSSQFVTYEAANEVINEILKNNVHKYPIYTLDFATANIYSVINGRRYYNNEYLFFNLAKLYGGNYYSTGASGSFDAGLIYVTENSTVLIDHFDMHMKVTQGITYGNFNSASQIDGFPANKFITQLGLYQGDFPIEIELTGFVNSNLFYKKYTLEKDQAIQLDSTAKSAWHSQNLIRLETGPNPSLNSVPIIQKSIDNRILSIYTAFLCLEDSSHLCTNCHDETKTPTANEDISQDSVLQLVVLPNPVKDVAMVELKGSESLDPDQFTGRIIDITGHPVHNFNFEKSTSDNKLEYRWDVHHQNQVPAGVYFIVVQSSSRIISAKFVKY